MLRNPKFSRDHHQQNFVGCHSVGLYVFWFIKTKLCHAQELTSMAIGNNGNFCHWENCHLDEILIQLVVPCTDVYVKVNDSNVYGNAFTGDQVQQPNIWLMITSTINQPMEFSQSKWRVMHACFILVYKSFILDLNCYIEVL